MTDFKVLIFICIGLLLLPSLGNCQDTNSKWTLGLNASLDYYAYHFSNDDGTGVSNFNYKSRLSYSIGLSSSYQVSKRFSIGLATLYSEKGFNKVYYGLPPNWENLVQSNYFLGFLDMPISLNYDFISREKFSMSLSGGLNTSILISLRGKGFYQNGGTPSCACSDMPIAKILVGVKSGFILEKRLNKNIGLFLNPYFNYSFVQLNDLLLLSNPFSFGLGFGVLYHI